MVLCTSYLLRRNVDGVTHIHIAIKCCVNYFDAYVSIAKLLLS